MVVWRISLSQEDIEIMKWVIIITKIGYTFLLACPHTCFRLSMNIVIIVILSKT